MLITKRISAFEQLNVFAQDNWDKVGKLVKYILDNGKENEFDFYTNEEFPNGCDEDEFKRFCLEETCVILANIGYKDAWEFFWGDDAEYDIAQDCEVIYEKKTGMSSVLWTPDLEKHETPTDDLQSRPEEYSTHGYTCDFEDWGIEMCQNACKNGCKNVDEVMKFIMYS